MAATPETISLRHATEIIDSLTRALRIEGKPHARIESMLDAMRELLDRPRLFCTCRVFETWEGRRPTLASCFSSGEFPGTPAQREKWDSQWLIDLGDDIANEFNPRIFDEPRRPVTIIFPDEFPAEVVKHAPFAQEAYLPIGFTQGIFSLWAVSPQRSLSVSANRIDGDAPFDVDDRRLVALMLRAIAPLVDRDMFRARDVFDRYELTSRQRDVLSHLLTGQSEKEIASEMHRSIHTIHSHISQLHDLLGVSSRGELMALFIDDAFSNIVSVPERQEPDSTD